MTVVAPGASPYWAKVLHQHGQQVVVADEKQRQFTVLREHTHKRKVVSVAHAVVSDDPHHDTSFVQAAIPQINKWIEANRSAIKCGVILEHLVRSDGAGSHFKNKFTMQFMTKFKTEQGLVRATWCIGCPGHGKGKWDGLAGMLKEWLRRMIMDSVLLIKEARQVYELLRGHFMSDKWKSDHEMNYISVMNIMYISEDDVVRKEPYSSDCTAINAHGRGCRDLFSFEGVRTNCLQSRVFSCWCVPCTLDGLVSWYKVHDAAPPAVVSCMPNVTQLLQVLHDSYYCTHTTALISMESDHARTRRSGMCRPSMKSLSVASRHSALSLDSTQRESVMLQRWVRSLLLNAGIRAGLHTAFSCVS